MACGKDFFRRRVCVAGRLPTSGAKHNLRLDNAGSESGDPAGCGAAVEMILLRQQKKR
jgi:hypothetical protein